MQRRGRSIYRRLILKIKTVFSKFIVLRVKSRAMACHLELVQIREAHHADVDMISSLHKQFLACQPSAHAVSSLPFRTIISFTHSWEHAVSAWERFLSRMRPFDRPAEEDLWQNNEMDSLSGKGSKATLDDMSTSSLCVLRFFPHSYQMHDMIKGVPVLGQRDFFILILSSSIHLASLMNPFL